ncbi:MAG: adenylate/guanylate cyclase domain-containing protein [Alphaproteobacteria bacterium]|nr:adenylate/guanylate cyclase domain-containing protein [Alphaproteobacteria bacterium]
MSSTEWSPTPTALWLLREGWQIADSEQLAEQVSLRLQAEGLSLIRAFFGIPSLHPLYFASAAIWRRDRPGEYLLGAHRDRRGALLGTSPLRGLEEATEVRHRLDGSEDVSWSDVLVQFRGEGGTDYAAFTLPFFGQQNGVASFVTDAPGGYTEADLDRLRRLLPALGRVLDLRSVHDTATNLLNTYVGRDAGERILRGRIQRGDVERIDAAILFCDLRGFTAMSRRLDGDALVGTLNAFFDAVAEPVTQRGGEVLKFMGDGLLAIFSSERRGGAEAACADAIAAAEEALDALEAGNAAREAAGLPALTCGMALHLGEVFYGNIGAADRLDFTVIGAAVNLASRLEGLCKQLEVPLVMSADFAARCGRQPRSLGSHRVRGLEEAVEVFGVG